MPLFNTQESVLPNGQLPSVVNLTGEMREELFIIFQSNQTQTCNYTLRLKSVHTAQLTIRSKRGCKRNLRAFNSLKDIFLTRVHVTEPGALDYCSISWKLLFCHYLELGPKYSPDSQPRGRLHAEGRLTLQHPCTRPRLRNVKRKKKDKHDSRHIPCLISMAQFLLSIKQVLKQSTFFSPLKSTVLESWQVHLFKQSSQVFCWQVFPEFLEHNSLDRICANIHSNRGKKVFSFATVETPKCLRCKAGHSVRGLILALGQGINK